MLASEQHILFVFPGQGSQYPGMGGDLCDEYPVAKKSMRRRVTFLVTMLQSCPFMTPMSS